MNNDLQNQIKQLWESTLCGNESPSETIKNPFLDSHIVDRELLPTITISSLSVNIAEDAQTILDSPKTEYPSNETVQDTVAETVLEQDDLSTPHQTSQETIDGTVVEQGTVTGHSVSDTIQSNTNDFTFLKELGRGGMGVVYLALQNSLRREVAIKSISGHNSDDTAQARFVSEAMVTAELDHPNIVPVHSLACDQSGSIYMAMKRVDGFSWQSLLRPKTPKEQQAAQAMTLLDHLEILLKVCDAVSFAHSHNIIHRDLKPANIMIGHFGEVLLMDWGIAIDVSSSPGKPQKLEHRSQICHPAGTPNYMAPEMASGDNSKIGFATDVYLLGAVLYEVLTGTPPHQGDGILQILCSASLGKVDPPQQRAQNREIPEELNQIVLRAMAKEPTDRYATVKELQKALRDYIAHYESLTITRKAQKILEQIKTQEEQKQLTIDQGYLDCDNAFNSFQRALEIWSDNQKAYQGAVEAAKIQAHWALEHGDTRVCLLQVQRLKTMTPPALTEASALEKKLKVRKISFKRSMIGFAIAVFIAFITYQTIENVTLEHELAESQKKQREEFETELNQVRSNYDPKKLLSILGKMENSPRKQNIINNEIVSALQCGNYKIAEEYLLACIQSQNIPDVSKETAQKLASRFPSNLQLDFLETRHSLHKVFSKLTYYTQLGISGKLLVESWHECENHKALPGNLAEALILCLSAKFYWDHNQPQKFQEQVEELNKLSLNQQILGEPPFEVVFEKRDGVLWAMHKNVEKTWCFSSYYMRSSNFLLFPEKKQLFLGYGSFLLVLDAETGKIVQRHHVGDRIVYLQNAGDNIEIEYGEMSTSTIRFSLSQQKFDKTIIAGVNITNQIQIFTEMSQAFRNAGIQTEENGNLNSMQWSNPAVEVLPVAERFIEYDATNIAYVLAKAMCLVELQKSQQANVVWQQVIDHPQLSIYEYIFIGNLCFEKGQKDWARQAFSMAKKKQAETFHNPQIASGLVSSPVIFIRKTCANLLKQEKLEDLVELLEEGRHFAHFVEGDYYVYRNLANICQEKYPEHAKTFSRRIDVSVKQGGGVAFSSDNSMIYLDLLIPFCMFSSFAMVLLLLFTWHKYRGARIQDLASLGWRTMLQRNFAFLATPLRRLRYTFVSYMPPTEKLALVLVIIAFIASNSLLLTMMRKMLRTAVAPTSICNGYLGHPEAEAYIEKYSDNIAPTYKNLLLAEGAYQQNLLEDAQKFWEKSLPNPIAKNNLACLVASQDLLKAQQLWQELSNASDIVVSSIAKVNLKIVAKQAISKEELTNIPTMYQNMYSHSPQKPILLQCDYSIFRHIFNSEFMNYREFLKEVFYGNQINSVLSVFNEIDEDGSFDLWMFVIILRLPLAVFAFALLVSMLFRVRPSQVQYSSIIKFSLKIFDKLGHLVPGVTFIINNRIFTGTLLLLGSIITYSFVMVWSEGGLLSNIAVPAFFLTGDENIVHPLHETGGQIALVLLLVMIVSSVLYSRRNKILPNISK